MCVCVCGYVCVGGGNVCVGMYEGVCERGVCIHVVWRECVYVCE